MGNGPYLGPAVVRVLDPGVSRQEFGWLNKTKPCPTREEWEAHAGDWYSVSPTGCWLWIRYTVNGHAFVCFGGRSHRARRVAYELFREPIPARMNVALICENRSCVNPRHMRLEAQGLRLRRKTS